MAAGGIAGKLVMLIGVTALPQIFVMAGMASVAATVVGAPISVVLIVFELTGSYEFAVAAMLSVVVATFLCGQLFGHSFFDRQLLARGIDLSHGRSAVALMSISICDIVTQKYQRFGPEETVGSAIKKMTWDGFGEAYCVDNKDKFCGK